MKPARKPKQLSRKSRELYLKRARRGMKGFTISWRDDDPFSDNGDIHGGEIDHANPIQKLICIDMWRRTSDWIVNAEFNWQVIMRVVFTGAPKGEKWDDYDFLFTCSLRGKKSEILNDAMEKCLKESLAGNAHYKDGDSNKGVYSHCEFLAVIVGV